jgi:transposase-like protein
VLGVELANRESRTKRDSLLGLKERCYVHFLRNALDHLPRKADDDCLTELRWIYDRRDLAAWLGKWRGKYPKAFDWVAENVEGTFAFYGLPVQHHKHMKSTNMLERLNQGIKRRTHILRVFSNEASCPRLVRALAAEMHEEWMEGAMYLDMEHCLTSTTFTA